MTKSVSNKTIDNVTIRFAGDSGDGMQLSGGRFTQTSAVVGNDLSTLPDFPAEIRAPAGSLAGVSSYQIHFSSQEIHTPGERPDVLDYQLTSQPLSRSLKKLCLLRSPNLTNLLV